MSCAATPVAPRVSFAPLTSFVLLEALHRLRRASCAACDAGTTCAKPLASLTSLASLALSRLNRQHRLHQLIRAVCVDCTACASRAYLLIASAIHRQAKVNRDSHNLHMVIEADSPQQVATMQDPTSVEDRQLGSHYRGQWVIRMETLIRMETGPAYSSEPLLQLRLTRHLIRVLLRTDGHVSFVKISG